jgi:predicted Zn finger-like uncharacterized protein
MPLTTRCGRCGRLFPVYAQELRVRRGRVSCPQCGNRFDALGALVDEPVHGRESADARARLGFGRRPGSPAVLHRTQVQPLAPAAGTGAGPGVGPVRSRRGRLARLGWWLAALLLILALPAQLAWWQRGQLLRDPGARALLAGLCGRLGCLVPAPRLPETLTLLEPSLTPGQDQPPGPGSEPQGGTLTLRLSVRNDATLPQPPPVLGLELFGPQGELAAARRFAPRDYGLADPARLLGPGETLPLALTLREPGIETSGFRVRLW